MNLSKNQIVMLAIGGVSLAVAALFGFLAFDAYSSETESAEAAESGKSTVRSLLGAEISPEVASVSAIVKNCDSLAGWTEAALSAAASGDCAIDANVNEAAFKQKLVDEARELSGLPGGVDGKIVKADFAFGFPDLVTGDKLPDREMLPKLQRQWTDIRIVVEALVECGIVELVRIDPASAKPVQAETAPTEGKKPRKRGKAAKVEEKPSYTKETYSVEFRARPDALVKAVNALATSKRFIVVETLDFAREGDMIARSLEDGDKKGAIAEKQPARPRRRRRSEDQPEAEATPAPCANGAGEADNGVVNDPAKEEPFLVHATLATYDFGSAANAAPGDSAAEAGKEGKEGEE